MKIEDSEHRLNVLVAYPYCKPDILKFMGEHKSEVRFLLDSGAFTAWKAGGSVNLDEYCKFIELNGSVIWRYFALDVIGDAEKTARNYETMLARGLKPVPIFTRGENPAHIDDLYATSDLIGVGGLVQTRGNKGFVNGVMKKIAGRKVHLLGFNSLSFIKYHKPYSCDATSWVSAQMFGTITLYDGSGGFLKVTADDFRDGKTPTARIVDRLRYYGARETDFLKRTAWRGGVFNSDAMRVNLRAFAHFALDLKKNVGTKYFFACTAATQVERIYDAHLWIKDKENDESVSGIQRRAG